MADRNPSKKRRQAQNKALREEREARAAAARVAPEERRVAAQPTAKPRRSERGARSATKNRSTPSAAEAATPAAVPEPAKPARTHSVFASKRRRGSSDITDDGTRPARTASGVARATGIASAATSRPTRKQTQSPSPDHTSDSPDEADEFEDGVDVDAVDSDADADAPEVAHEPRMPGKPLPPWLDRFGGNEPGGRWVLMSFLMVIVASGVMAATPVVPEQVLQENGKLEATGRVLSIWHFGLLQGFALLLPPLLAVGLAIVFARPPERRRSWNRGLFALILLVMLGGTITFYAVSVGCLAWGCWQARKAALAAVGNDPAALRAQSRALRAERVASSRWARRSKDQDDDVTDDTSRRGESTSDGTVDDDSGRRIKSKRVTQGK